MNMEKMVIEAYRDGNDLKYMGEALGITYDEIKDILVGFKVNSKHGRTFTDEFKKIIAERDMNGISRRQISTELEINAHTVKKACEAFGQVRKEKAQPINEFTKIDGNFDGSKCPTCESKDVREVDEDTIYCFDCGNEHEIYDSYVLRVNWEHVD